MLKTYYHSATGKYLGSYEGPEADNPYAGHDSVDGSFGGLTKLLAGIVVADPDVETAAKDAQAAAVLDRAINKTLRDVLLDLEQRLRAAGLTSTLPDIAAATNKAEYRAALKEILNSYL